MKIQALVHLLQQNRDLGLLHTQICRPDQVVRRVQIVDALPRPPLDDTLYLCKTPPMGPIPSGCSLVATCWGPEPRPFPHTEEGNVIVSAATDLEQLEAVLNGILTQEHELDRAMLRLSEAFLSDRGIAYMSDEAAAIFQNPFWLIDINFNFMTDPQLALIDEDDFLSQEIALGYVMDRHVENIKQRKIYEYIQRTGETVAYSAYIAPERKIMAAPIRIKSVTVGFLQLGNNHAPFRAYDTELLRYAAKLFAAELQKRQHVEINQGNTFASLLKNLLDGQIKNKANLYQRMGTLGIAPGRRFQFLAIPIDEGKVGQTGLSTIASQIRYFLLNSIYIIEPAQILFLINLYGEAPLDEDTLKDIREYLSNNRLRAGLSPVFQDILQAPVYRPLATKAAEIGGVLAPEGSLYHYDDYFLYHMIDESYQSIPPVAPTAGANLQLLSQYDKEHHTMLFETLYCYLDCLQNVALSAERLGIHGNTLRNRVEKIKQLTCCNFDQGRQVVEYLMSYQSLTYRNALSHT